MNIEFKAGYFVGYSVSHMTLSTFELLDLKNESFRFHILQGRKQEHVLVKDYSFYKRWI